MTAQTIAHERMRFETMTPKQLLTRLYRITKPEKLDGYIMMAKEKGYTALHQAAVNKKAGLTRSKNLGAIAQVMENKIIEAQEKVIVQNITYQRSLEF